MLLIVATLALQAFSPALAFTPAHPGSGSRSSFAGYVASSCAAPKVEAAVKTAAFPELPHGAKASGMVNVAVTLDPGGRVTHAAVVHSSGNAVIDNAVVTAARNSTYSPKLVNCTPVEGQYLFHADFKPSP